MSDRLFWQLTIAGMIASPFVVAAAWRAAKDWRLGRSIRKNRERLRAWTRNSLRSS